MQHSQQLKEKLSGLDQSAGTRTIVISLMASPRLVSAPVIADSSLAEPLGITDAFPE
jgi:hypothetical protein